MKIKKVSLTGILVAVVFVTSIIASAIAISATSEHNVFAAGSDKYEYELSTGEVSYAISLSETNGKPYFTRKEPYFTRTEMESIVINDDLKQENIDIRQPHLQAEIIVDNDGVILYEVNYFKQYCDNTYYYIINDWRVCSTCAYVFTIEQEEKAGLRDIMQ